MKILLLLLISFPAFADCVKTWEKENATNPVVSRCATSTIELVELKSGCALEGGEVERCLIVRTCDDKKEIGASVFRASSPAESYCLSKAETDAMASSSKTGPKALIKCRKKNEPESIRLVSGKETKNCPFPFKDNP